MHRRLLISALLALGSGQAMAGSPVGLMTIEQNNSNGSTTVWTENLVGANLISLDQQTGNFIMAQGVTGQTITTDNVDYWAWQSDKSWLWHSAQTVSGKTLSIADQMTYTDQANDPWAAVAKLTAVSGHGDPDLSYGFFAKNNTSSVQTYTVTIGGSITTPVGGPATVYADIAGSLTNPSGSLTIAPVAGNPAIQRFLLSAGGGPLVNAGVNVGSAYTASATGTSIYNPSFATGVAPTGGAWDYMQITSQFTLTPDRDVASISGFASITPVPEPESYAMLLAGLGIVGFIGRRKKTPISA